MKRIMILLLSAFVLVSCTIQDIGRDKKESNSVIDESGSQDKTETALINKEGKTVQERIKVPAGFQRVEVERGSFQEYLRNLPLKSHGADVLYYNGSVKTNRNVHEAVVDMDIGERDLQQCADAVMRLRGEYLYWQGKYDKIHFNFTNGFRVDYAKWMEGYRIAVDGNNTYWVKRKEPSNTYQDFRSYMDLVFAYAGTLSLSKELKPVEADNMIIGDIIIQGGSPGHAVIVVDMAENKSTGEKLFLLAQSYMPAQDIHILKNPVDQQLSPWYRLDFGEKLYTPEWTFNREDVKRF